MTKTFSAAALFCLLTVNGFTSSAFAQSAKSNEILIGQTVPLSGTLMASSAEMIVGSKLYLDSINASGGVRGRKIKLIQIDDGSDPKRSAENTKKLIADGVLAIFLPRGTSNAELMAKVTEEAGIAMVAPSTGANTLHEPPMRTVFNVRSKYQAELIKSMQLLVAQGHKKFAYFGTTDNFGKDVKTAYDKAIQDFKLTATGVELVDNRDPKVDVVAPMDRSLAGNPAVIIVQINLAAGSRAIIHAKATGKPVQIVALSNVALKGFVTALGDSGHGVMVSQVFPSATVLNTPFGRAVNRLVVESGIKDATPGHAEGVAAAMVLVEGLRRAGASPTRESVISGLEAIKGFDLGGVLISYGPNDRTGSDFLELSIIDKRGRFLQ
jgi:branched-chain amino acid transport system substrate-binding protein